MRKNIKSICILSASLVCHQAFGAMQEWLNERMHSTACLQDTLSAQQALNRIHLATACNAIPAEYADIFDLRKQSVLELYKPFGTKYSYPTYAQINNGQIRYFQAPFHSTENPSIDIDCDALEFGFIGGLCVSAPVEELSYSEAVERVEWAYRCGHLGDRDTQSPYSVKNNFVVDAHGVLKSKIRYPIFKNKDGYFSAPIDRYADCNEANKNRIIDFSLSDTAMSCETERLKAYIYQYLTEAEYLEMKQQDKAPVQYDESAEHSCRNLVTSLRDLKNSYIDYEWRSMSD
jgi:hypothetical protein